MCYNFPKVPAVALNHLSNAEVSTDMFLIYFSVHAKCFCPTILSVHVGAALSEHDMKSKLDPSLSLHSWPPVW